MVDRSVKIPRGIVEDVLIQIENFSFPVDLIVLDTMPVQNSGRQIPVILGRPFLATTNTRINCRNGVMKFSFGNMKVKLKIFYISKQPPHGEEINAVCIIGIFIRGKFIQTSCKDPLEACVAYFGSDFDIDESIEQVNALLNSTPMLDINKWQPKVIHLSISSSPPIPSVVEPPQLELKLLPNTLKYAFLGPSESLQVIVAFYLDNAHEQKLLDVLNNHKEAMGRSINDIKGISPSVVMHIIIWWRMHWDLSQKNKMPH